MLGEILTGAIPRLLVLNKADLLDDDGERATRLRHPEGVLVSALRAPQRQALLDRLVETIRELRVHVRIECPTERFGELCALARRGERRPEAHLDGRVWSEWWLDRAELGRVQGADFRVEILDRLVVGPRAAELSSQVPADRPADEADQSERDADSLRR